MKKLLPTLLACCMAPLAAQADIRLNEVHYSVPGPDGNYEFIELKSTTNAVESCAGLTLVIIGNSLSEEGDAGQPAVRLNPGIIVEALDLSDLSTGTNGLLLLGNGYTDTPLGGPWAGAIDPATAVGDPEGLGNSDIDYNTGLTVLLVRGYDKVRGAKGADIDIDVHTGAGSSPISTGNGVIDWNQNPVPAGSLAALWTEVVDSIGIQDVVDKRDPTDSIATNSQARKPYVPNAADITFTWAVESTNKLTERDADTFARRLGSDTASNAQAWYGGQLREDSTNPTEVIYRTGRTFGPSNMVGEVTPGRPNLSTGITTPVFRINEVGLNPSGNVNSDDRFQYVEIINTEGQARSLNGYWLILVDSFDGSADITDTTGVGSIIEEWNLSDLATGTNGLLLLGDGFSSGFTPFQDAVDPRTACGDPAASNGPPASSGWGSRDLKFKDGFTMFLVRGYQVPSGKDIDPNDDGIADVNIGATIIDRVGFSQAGAITKGRTYSSVNLRTVMDPIMVPDNFSRKLGNLDSEPATAATAWYGGRYPGSVSPMSLGFALTAPTTEGGTFSTTWFGGFRGAATPGQPNLAATISPTAPPLASPIRINEVMFNPTNDAAGNDQSNEYVELISTNQSIAHMENLWMLVVELGNSPGNIKTGSPLSGYTTGLNGIALIGDGYDNINNTYSAFEGPLPMNSAAFDPPVGMEQNDLPNEACAIIIVRGIKGPITLNANGKPIGDLDPDNDGVLLPFTDYSDELLDSIAISPVSPGAGYGWIDSTAFLPHNIARYPGNYTANSAASWYGGQIPQTPGDPALPFTNYAGQFFGNFQGAASPGRYNHGATPGPVTAGSVVFNEINFNPAGADNNFEFIELLSTNGAARSLNGYTIVALDNQVSNTGEVRHAWSLDGMATGSNGLLMMGNGYTAGQNPFQAVVRPQTGLGDPPGRDGLNSSLGNGSIGGDTGNVSLAYLLVRNFNSFIEADLDEKSTVPVPGQQPVEGLYDTPGDGVLDAYPWQGGLAGILDSVLLRSYDPDTTNGTAAPYPYDGWTYGLANLTAAFFPTPGTLFYHPESIARFRGEVTPNDATAWYGGDLKGGDSGNSGTAEDYLTAAQDALHPPRPEGFWGRVTPGQPNVVRTAMGDTDSDGLPNLVESGINTDPANAASAAPIPAPTLITDAGLTYIGFSYPRLRSGTVPVPFPYAAEAYTYIVESSPDLITWTADSGTGGGALIPVGTPVVNPDGVTETATLRLPVPVTTAPGRHYLRLRVTRR